MSQSVAIIHWVEGAGHAARALPIAKALEDRGIDVTLAGGGPGQKFVELNGFNPPEMPEINVSENIRNPEMSRFQVGKRFLTEDLPSMMRRYRKISKLFRHEHPDAVLTDDPCAVMAATRRRIPFYRLDHLIPNYFSGMTKATYSIYNRFCRWVGEDIIITSLWDIEGRDSYTSVGPLAQEGDASVDSFDVLLIPGSWSDCFDAIKEELSDRGYEVRMVGDDEWEPAPAMTPYTRAADCVICTGFSAIADTVVAGTPCLVYPFMPFQRALADQINSRDVPGVDTVQSVKEAVNRTESILNDNPTKPAYENGAKAVVDNICAE